MKWNERVGTGSWFYPLLVNAIVTISDGVEGG